MQFIVSATKLPQTNCIWERAYERKQQIPSARINHIKSNSLPQQRFTINLLLLVFFLAFPRTKSKKICFMQKGLIFFCFWFTNFSFLLIFYSWSLPRPTTNGIKTIKNKNSRCNINTPHTFCCTPHIQFP